MGGNGKMNVFLDTNVVVDFMGEREGFFEDAALIFTMAKDKLINISISALTVVNCAYILKKAFNNDDVLSKVDALCKFLDITPINNTILQGAVSLKPYDFEDAVQFLSSLECRPDLIITRDKKGFNNFGIMVMTPSEFVEKVKAN